MYPLEPGQNRPELDYQTCTAPSIWTYVGFFHGGFLWKEAAWSMLNTLRTTLMPAVVWATLANGIFIIVNSAAQQITSFALLAQGWEFQYTGLSVLPFIGATALVYVFAGPVADRVANAATRHNNGSREPEHHLLNTGVPFIAGIAGCFIFGYAGQNNVHWGVLLFGSFLIIFAFLTILSVVNVFIVESYPMWAGPVLVNVSSLRLIIAFFLSSQATAWIAEKGFLGTFAIYAEAIIVVSLGIPLLYFFGKKMRVWTAGRVSRVKATQFREK
jgi:MFS family permease